MTITRKAWYNKAYIDIAVESGANIVLRAKTTSLNISGGNFDLETIETFGGKVKRFGAREDFEITMDGIQVSIADFDWIFHGVSNTDTSITSSTIKDYRLIFLWTNETGVTGAGQAVATASEAHRELYAECNLVSLEKSMDAGEHLSATLTFKTPFEDDAGSINFKEQDCDTTSALTAAGAYTSANKF